MLRGGEQIERKERREIREEEGKKKENKRENEARGVAPRRPAGNGSAVGVVSCSREIGRVLREICGGFEGTHLGISEMEEVEILLRFVLSPYLLIEHQRKDCRYVYW